VAAIELEECEIANALTEQDLRSGRLTGKPEVTAKICQSSGLPTIQTQSVNE
jgi:hypothetical protein